MLVFSLSEVEIACGIENTCSLCDYTNKRTKLIRHLKVVHKLLPWVCKKCKKVWQKSLFDDHPCNSSENTSPFKLTSSSKSKLDGHFFQDYRNKVSKIYAVLGGFSEEVGDKPCGFKLSCSLCTFSATDRVAILRHFRLTHKIRAKMCRNCHTFFQRACFKDHSCGEENSTPSKGNFLFPLENKLPLSKLDMWSHSSNRSSQSLIIITYQPKITAQRTPTKRDLKAPTQFYSRRYRELLQEFSPKKAVVECSDLKDLLKSSRFHRNGKLDLSYVTPKQEKAVREFMIGKSDKVVSCHT